MLNITIIFIFVLICGNDCFSQQFWDWNNNGNKTGNQKASLGANSKKDSVLNRDRKAKLKVKSYRSPFIAGALALFPGFIFHGAGHLYARKPIITAILFLTSVYAIKLFSVEDPSTEEQGYPIYYKPKHYDLEVNSGIFLWWGTWAYDLIGAPIVCIRHNKRLKQKLSLNPYLVTYQFGNQIGIRLSYGF